MSETMVTPVEKKDYEKLKEYMEMNGMKQSHIWSNLGRSRGWMSRVLQGDIVLTEQNKKAIEELIPTFKF